jgi:TonB family protein
MHAVQLPVSEDTFRRCFPRHPLCVPLDLTALRFGVPETLPGRCTDISEGGLGAVVAGDLSPGQQVAIELRLPHVGVPLRARAFVRYQSRLSCGLELVALSRDQLDMIRYWLYRSIPEPGHFSSPKEQEKEKLTLAKSATTAKQPDAASILAGPVAKLKSTAKRSIRFGRRGSYLLGACILAMSGLGWWQWQRSWNDLETHSPGAQSRLHVSAETMGTRLVTKIDPVYPEAARQMGTQGIVVLDAVIAADGSVKKLRPVSGPDVLVQSTTTAVGAWKFEPYLASGKPVEVETTIAVEFRLD